MVSGGTNQTIYINSGIEKRIPSRKQEPHEGIFLTTFIFFEKKYIELISNRLVVYLIHS